MSPLLHEWETFYVIVGSSAAALTGLQFVVIALLSEATSLQGGEHEMKAFGTPQVVHFCAVLLIAAICSTPRQSATSLSLCLTLSAIVALVYTIGVVMHARHQTGYKPVFEDWLWHAILPLTAYTSLLIAGICIYARSIAALYVVAAAALLLLYIGIHNAWDTALYISSQPRKRNE